MRLLPTGARMNGTSMVVPEHGGLEVAGGRGHGRPRPEHHVLEGAAVLAQGPLAFGAAVDVVERHARQPPHGQVTEVGNGDGA